VTAAAGATGETPRRAPGSVRVLPVAIPIPAGPATVDTSESVETSTSVDTFETVVAALRTAIDEMPERTGTTIAVVEAAALGPRVPVERRVVEVLTRGEEVLAERFEDSGLRRLVRLSVARPHGGVRTVELPDAGARSWAAPAGPATSPVLAFPLADPHDAATRLRDEVGVGVVLVSRAVRPSVLLAAALPASTPSVDEHALALAVDLVDDDAALVLLPAAAEPTSEGGTRAEGTGAADRTAEPPTRAAYAPLDGRYEAVRSVFGLRPGTPDALEVGLPGAGAGIGRRPARHLAHDPHDHHGREEPDGQDDKDGRDDRDGQDGTDPVEERIERACRLAALPLPEVDPWHPVRRHVRARVDLAPVVTTVTQLGVLVEAADDLTLGVAVGRLVLALAAEGVPATPIRHDVTVRGSSPTCTCLVAFLGDEWMPR